jgi:ATP-dependent RNA circularization protein (DNA/RNA ligase family)
MRVTRGHVVVRRDDTHVVRGVPHIEVFGNLLLIEYSE